jgi:heme ABC exporter ATP-binding subunit CcmA
MEDASPVTAGPVIETRRVTKRFGSRLVLKGIDLKVGRGELVVLFGPNGAGKTTLLRILATIMNPTDGTVRINGLDSKANAEEIRRRIGVVSHQTFLYGDLTIAENLEFYARMYDLPGGKASARQAAEAVGMAARMNDRVCTLSRGMAQRVAIARAILHRPDILLFDEPETGLDQQIVAALWQTLRGDEGSPRTIVLSTHDVDRWLALGDRFLVLSRGALVYDGKEQAAARSRLSEAFEQSAGLAA